MNLSKNFTIEEFQAKGFPTIPTKKERFLLDCLVLRLQIVRELLGCPIIVTDCYRTYGKYQDMVYRGLFPSETSDHFWGQRIPVYREDKVAKYGTVYDLSVGAVDFFPNMNIDEAYGKIVKKVKIDGGLDVGQVIIEKSATSSWIHMSNPASVLYSADFIRRIIPAREMFLASSDGGKTYQAAA